METGGELRSEETLGIEQNQKYVLTSAHTTDHDSWQQVGLLLVTSFNCGWILSFSNLMLVPLGWTWGIICLFVVGLYSAYANWLLAGFHFIDGQRFIRYRDLMGFLFGREMYYITWVSQYLTLLLGNMGFILLGGKALKISLRSTRFREGRRSRQEDLVKPKIMVSAKYLYFEFGLTMIFGDLLHSLNLEINSEFSDSPLRLQYFIIVTGAAYFIFAFFIPTVSAMRSWLGVSTVLTFTYIGILLLVLVHDGKSNRSRDYEIPGSKVGKIFNGFGAISAIIVCNTSGLLLEIQSTLRKPAVKNMRKALYLQYTVGLIGYYGVSIVGYWAYGSTVSVYLPQELSGPKWAKVVINSAVFLQSIVSQHMFVAPIHETLDTNFLRLNESINSKENIKRRFLLRAILFTFNTFVTAAFPFMGDFVNLLGSFTLIPITFVFPSLIFIKVKGKTARLEKKVWHLSNIFLFSLLTIATTSSAVRIIVENIRVYNFFANT